jgi:phosphatidylglycerol:prolipoprotein diacylglycerol transferase
MIPYWKPPRAQIGALSISWQMLLAVAGIGVAHFLLLRRARRNGLNEETAAMMSLMMVMVGLIGAYWFRGVYFADAVKQDWHALLGLQIGAASFGGIAFGLTGGWIYLAAVRRLTGTEALRYLDALAYVFPQGWIFGRIGCSLIHDHPGRETGSVLGVRFPNGTRYDLGLIEVLFLAVLLIPLFSWLNRRKRPAGFWLGIFLALYGAFRLALDTLHVEPPRYGPFSVDQWAYGGALVLGLVLLAKQIGLRDRTTETVTRS